jgi:RHS repeat-associated protein
MRMSTIKSIGAWLVLSLWGVVACAGTVTYVYTDAQGTPQAEANASGTITAQFDYAPYGSAVASVGPAPNGPGYTGHVNDPDTGLVYMQARYYDPGRGGFISVDPVAPTPGNLFNFNRYDYTNNNPINHTDPDGRCIDGVTCGTMLSAHVAWRMSHPGAPADGMEKAAFVGVGVMVGASLAPISPELAAVAKFVVRRALSRTSQTDSGPTKSSPSITKAYQRPSGATTSAQRASVQGKPCVDCGAVTPRQVADHKDPLVKEYYETGTIDTARMHSTEAVQPQCPTCSARQGAEMSRYSRQMKKDFGLDKPN